jgi:hypothetical protein
LYEETTIQVLIPRVRGLKLDHTIRFPSGLVAPHGDSVVRDVHDRLLVWDTKVLRCQDRMSLMFQGPAKLHQARSASPAEEDLEEAIILVAQNETNRYFGLVLEGKKSMCGHVCHNTQIPDVVVCMDDDPNKEWKFQKALNHNEANLLTHIHFLYISRGLGNFQGFTDFQEAICQVDGRVCSTNSTTYTAPVSNLLVGLGSLRCPMSPWGGPRLRPPQLHSGDPCGNRVRGI